MASNQDDRTQTFLKYDSEDDRWDDLVDRMMASRKYGQYLKNLMAEVVEEKIGQRFDLHWKWNT